MKRRATNLSGVEGPAWVNQCQHIHASEKSMLAEEIHGLAEPGRVSVSSSRTTSSLALGASAVARAARLPRCRMDEPLWQWTSIARSPCQSDTASPD